MFVRQKTKRHQREAHQNRRWLMAVLVTAGIEIPHAMRNRERDVYDVYVPELRVQTEVTTLSYTGFPSAPCVLKQPVSRSSSHQRVRAGMPPAPATTGLAESALRYVLARSIEWHSRYQVQYSTAVLFIASGSSVDCYDMIRTGYCC